MSRMKYSLDFIRGAAKEQVDKIEALLGQQPLVRPINYTMPDQLTSEYLDDYVKYYGDALNSKNTYVRDVVEDDLRSAINSNLELADNLGIELSDSIKEVVKKPQSLFDMIEANRSVGHKEELKDINWLRDTIESDITLNDEILIHPKVKFKEQTTLTDKVGFDEMYDQMPTGELMFRLKRYSRQEADLLHSLTTRQRFNLITNKDFYNKLLERKIKTTELDDPIDIEAALISDLMQFQSQEQMIYDRIVDLIDEPLELGGKEFAKAMEDELQSRNLPDLFRLVDNDYNNLSAIDFRLDDWVSQNQDNPALLKMLDYWDQYSPQLYDGIDLESILLRERQMKYQGGLITANPKFYPDHIFYFLEKLQTYYDTISLDPTQSISSYISTE